MEYIILFTSIIMVFGVVLYNITNMDNKSNKHHKAHH